MSQKETRRALLCRQVERLDWRLTALARTSNRWSWARLGTFIAGLVISFAAFATAGLAVGVIVTGGSVYAFTLTASLHNRVKRAITRHSLWRTIKQTHIARMDLDWDALPPSLIIAPRPDHPLERDLDLVDARSLHHLLDTAVSREGSERLRDWLAIADPDPARIARRQALVRELAELPVFCDKLRLYALLASGGRVRRWESARLRRWLNEFTLPDRLESWRRGLTVLALVNLVLLVISGLTGFFPLWRVTLAVYVLLYGGLVVRLGNPFAAALALRDPLHDLQAVFGFLETHRYRDPGPLRDLCAPFLQRERRPSTYLARVGRVLAAASVRGNPPLWMALSVLMPWDLYVMRWLDRSRAALADLLPQWLDVWFEVEALSALATLAYLNPDYTFPEILGGNKNDPLLEARALGHPLIPDTERVCNDFTLRDSGDLAMITGSNMSGKSTFLRTIGVNVCLAYAGGPVNAQFFRAVPLRLYTCIRVTDSVTDGISYFYAEVKSLKRLLDALDGETPYPALYLIDEIFRGTNNRERLTGSRAYIRALVGRRGAGLLSTHDLELVHLADELPGITNYHFAETVAEGRMMFDYTLRPGPCPTTNALKIMQMEGLPVE